MNICVYGASGSELAREYFEAAEALGRLIARGGHTLVFGGGQSGLMGACARGAFAEGGGIVGVAPKFFDEPGILFPHCSRFIYTDTMRERKQAMENESEAIIVLPGGIGTFEEFFEMLTLKQLGRHGKPMAVLNTLGYYEAMVQMLEKAAEGRFMSRNCLSLFSMCQSPEEAMERIQGGEELVGSIRRLEDYGK